MLILLDDLLRRDHYIDAYEDMVRLSWVYFLTTVTTVATSTIIHQEWSEYLERWKMVAETDPSPLYRQASLQMVQKFEQFKLIDKAYANAKGVFKQPDLDKKVLGARLEASLTKIRDYLAGSLVKPLFLEDSLDYTFCNQSFEIACLGTLPRGVHKKLAAPRNVNVKV